MVKSSQRDEPEPDPLYKNIYLPRKFKIGIAIPPHNECDIFTQDIGLIAIIENNEFIGFNIAAGGGMGTTHGNEKTYPRLVRFLVLFQRSVRLMLVQKF